MAPARLAFTFSTLLGQVDVQGARKPPPEPCTLMNSELEVLVVGVAAQVATPPVPGVVALPVVATVKPDQPQLVQLDRKVPEDACMLKLARLPLQPTLQMQSGLARACSSVKLAMMTWLRVTELSVLTHPLQRHAKRPVLFDCMR